MTRRDLVVLAADKDMEHALRGLLSRHKSLPIRQIAFDIFVHPQHDAACATRGVPFLSPLSQRYQHALLILDHEGSGRETMSPDDLARMVRWEGVIYEQCACGCAGIQNQARKPDRLQHRPAAWRGRANVTLGNQCRGSAPLKPKQNIDFKDPLWIVAWLDTALEKEKEKYAKCPIIPDMVPGHDVAQGWGYVVAGYFLVEESFKALLYVRGNKKVPTKHSLSCLFDMLENNDKIVLREYYDDYRSTMGGTIGAFPFQSLDEFLLNLDGDANRGSFDWRYFLIEEKRSKVMPTVSVDYLHEIVYGCTRIVEYAHNGRFDPSRYTLSRRMRAKRKLKYTDWLTVRMNSEWWDDLGERLEILWGPDRLGRYDFLLFGDEGAKQYFSKIPDDLSVPVVDKRTEIEKFDVEKGYRSIGVFRPERPPSK